MSSLLRSRLTWVWLLLSAATLLSFEVSGGSSVGIKLAGVAVIVVAFVKVRYVILEFMELRHAPRPFRIAAELWPLIICSALIVLYLRGLR